MFANKAVVANAVERRTTIRQEKPVGEVVVDSSQRLPKRVGNFWAASCLTLSAMPLEIPIFNMGSSSVNQSICHGEERTADQDSGEYICTVALVISITCFVFISVFVYSQVKLVQIFVLLYCRSSVCFFYRYSVI